MSSALVVGWLTLAVAAAWTWRPTSIRRPDGAHHSGIGPDRRDRAERSSADSLVPSWLAPVRARTVLLVIAGSFAALPVAGALAPVGGVGLLMVIRSHARRAIVARSERSLGDVAVLVDLLAVAVVSGLSPGAALVAVASHVRRGHDAGLTRLVADLDRGRSLADAMADWICDTPTRELAGLILSADDGGVAVVDSLERLGRDLRRRRRRSAEQRARRLPVTMLVPLVTCVLPAFGLLTVVPMVAVGLGRLGSLP